MGKKYLNTKDGSIEQSILDVWQEAAEMHAEGMDGRTKEYRAHRGKLESNRAKQENKKNSVKTEQPETQHGSGEHSYEIGTDRYREHTQKLTPGQTEEGIIGNIAKAGAKAVGRKIKSTAKSAYGKTIVGKAQSAISKKVKKVGSAIKRVKKAAQTGEEVEIAEMEKENMTENLNLRDTIKNLWIEAASSAVNPKDREELDKEPDGRGGVESAKKMKRAKKPVPNVSEELDEASGDKEAYQKFFDAALKKFKINSPADLKSDEEKKKFFDYIDKNWEGDNEKAEELIQLAKEFKVSSMREALAKVWGLDEGEKKKSAEKTGWEKHTDIRNKIYAKKKDKEEKNEGHDDENGKTLTGKKAAKIDIDPGLESKK